MPAPTFPTLTEGQWNLVASNTSTGIITQLKSNFSFWGTYVVAGATAPIDAVKDTSPRLFQDSNIEEISAIEAIDVYIWLENSDTSVDSSPDDSIQVAI